MKADANIARIMGWPSNAVSRTIVDGLVYASWFPVNSDQAVLFSGGNRASVQGKLPMSKALEEEYRRQPPVASAFRNRSPYKKV